MTKVLVISDSHSLTERIDSIANRHDVQKKIHCGDSELAHDAQQLDDFVVVRGNCDWDSSFPEDEIIDIAGLRIFVTHGHLYGVKSSLLQLQYRALEEGADIVLFGHSHVAYCEKFDNVMYINPGSIRLPRKWPTPSYCIISWENREEINVVFYDIEGNELMIFPFERTFKL